MGMIAKYSFFFIGLFSCLTINAQTIDGRVLDAANGQALESVAIYFDNTTIGTTTNDDGVFSLDYNEAVQSTLVISYLGYEKVFISDYRTRTDFIIRLVETTNELEEVLINYDDGLTRKQKLRLFRKEFLGNSEFAKSCKILNEDDLFLKYDSESKTLSASAKKPILVTNKLLQYEISYDLIDFEIAFNYVRPKDDNFSVISVIYFGTSYYKNLKEEQKRGLLKRRKKAYLGSVQHFMRSLYEDSLEKEGFIFGKRSFKVDPAEFFTVESIPNNIKKVTLTEKLDIFFKDDESVLQLSSEFFYIDRYGNHSPIETVLFGGDMGSQRIGDSLPSDYALE